MRIRELRVSAGVDQAQVSTALGPAEGSDDDSSMPRLKIELEDWWTTERRTRLDLRTKGLGGSGISLDVWQHLFDFHDGSWHADVQDANVTLVSLEISSEARAATGQFKLNECNFDRDQISSRLESLPLRSFPLLLRGPTYVFGYGDLRTLDSGLVRAFLYLHDDCFFALASRDPSYLSSAVRLIVRVHEHYLGIDLDSAREDEVTRKVLRILERESSIQLQSDPSACTTRIWSEASWLSRLLGRRQPADEVLSLAP